MSNVSTLSKKFKSPEWKARKVEQHRKNVAQRAELHREKSIKGSCGDRASVQAKIDQMSQRG